MYATRPGKSAAQSLRSTEESQKAQMAMYKPYAVSSEPPSKVFGQHESNTSETGLAAPRPNPENTDRSGVRAVGSAENVATTAIVKDNKGMDRLAEKHQTQTAAMTPMEKEDAQQGTPDEKTKQRGPKHVPSLFKAVIKQTYDKMDDQCYKHVMSTTWQLSSELQSEICRCEYKKYLPRGPI